MIPHGFAQAWCTLTTYMMGYDFPRQKISSRVEKKTNIFSLGYAWANTSQIIPSGPKF
jgi:hypothetical protein